jgi:MFS family permease
VNSCNLGYDVGVNTQAGPLLKDAMALTVGQLEFFLGSLNLFAMVGALSAHVISDRYGRRASFITAAVCFIVGVLIVVMAQSFTTLMMGRVFVGLGVGFGLAIDSLYISEISPAANRGRLVTWCEIGTNVGVLLGFGSGYFFRGIDENLEWRYMIALGTSYLWL